MSFVQFIRLILKNLKYLLLVPVVLATSIWYFTRHEVKKYSSEATVYTGIASGYSLNGSTRADFFATSNAFDNLLSIINSRETKEEVAFDLLASHLFAKQHDPALLSWDSYVQLKTLVPDSVKQKLVKETLSETINSVTRYAQANEANVIYKIINSDHPLYSVNSLRGIVAMRINSSDLIKITYETSDAAVCKHTLEYLIDVFMKKHLLVREGQTSNVIAYFEQKVKEAYRRLDSCEGTFLAFNKQNDIINYYEQTKSIAGEKERLYALNHQLEMDRNASEKAVDKVNDDLKGKVYQTIYGSDVIGEREKLSDVYNKIAYTEVLDDAPAVRAKSLDSLHAIASSIEKAMQSSIQQLAAQYNTPKGIPVKAVLDEWVKQTIGFEQGKARLTIMDKRKKEFAEEYRKMAPLGAMLKKIERQISVAEQEYLELLHGLNQARLTQQSNELSSKLTIVDPPFLPVKPNASKRAILIAVGFIVGFVLLLAILLTKFLLNKTLRQPTKATKEIGAPLLGVYPLLWESKAFLEKANMRIVQELLSKTTVPKQPIVIGIVSNQKSEGKTTLVSVWESELKKLSFRTASWQAEDAENIPAKDTADFVFVELPALDSTILLPAKLPKMDFVLLVCRANRVWTTIDENLLQNFCKATKAQPQLVLNGVTTDYAEEFVGEVPKKRSRFRTMAKRIFKFEFGNQNKLFKS